MTIGLAYNHGNGGAAFIKQEADVENPFLLLNSNMLFYIFAFWVVGRYFGQATPLINMKPLLLLRIKITSLSPEESLRLASSKSLFLTSLILLLFHFMNEPFWAESK